MKRSLRELARVIATVRAASPCRPQPPGTGPAIPIHVGLDFGATATKAVYGQPDRPGFKTIEFHHRLAEYPSSCLPSLAAITAVGELRLGLEAAQELAPGAWDGGLRRFKLMVAGRYEAAFYDHESEVAFTKVLQNHGYATANFPELLTVAFLVYAMHRCRESVMRLPEYAGKELDFRFTVGIPPDPYRHHQLERAFTKIVEQADILDRKYWESARTKPAAGVTNREAAARRVAARAEPVAARAAYQTALQHTPGVYVLIEMGAGTTTVSIAQVRQLADQPGQCEWLAARNFPRGTFGIERAVAKLPDGGETMRGSELQQRLTTLDPAVAAEAARKICWSDDYYQLWHEACGKYRPAPRENPAATFESAPLYFTGGGALIPGVAAAFAQPYPWEKLRRHHRLQPLPTPPDYGSPTVDFTRMAVAYGLAVPAHRPDTEDSNSDHWRAKVVI